jgi:hypothetical protein
MTESNRKTEKGICSRMQRASAWLFYIGLTAELAIAVVERSDYTIRNDGTLFRGTFVVFLAAMLLYWTAGLRKKTISLRECLFLSAVLVLGLVSWICSGRNEILRFTVFIAACRSIDLRKAEIYAFGFTAAGCLLLAVLSLTGIFGTVKLTMDFGRGGVETRWCIGMGHPNALHCMAAMLIIFGLYLWQDRMRWYSYLLLFLFNGGLFCLTRSNTGLLITAYALLLSMLLRYCGKLRSRNFPYILLTEIVLAAVLVLSFCAAVWGDSIPLIAALDHPLNGRVASLFETSFKEGTFYTWSWFSGRSSVYYFDMGWVRLFYWYGVIPGLAVIALLYAVLREIRIRRDAAAAVMLSAFFIYTFMEAHLVSVYLGRNYALFIIASYVPVIFAKQKPAPGKAERIHEADE